MHARTTRRIAQLAIILLASIALLGAADTSEQRFNDIGHKLMCKCGCNQVLLECNHVGCTYSDSMRNELTAGIQRGDSDDLVLQSFVQKYGATVLAAPTKSGFNMVAWIVPFVALALGLWLTAVITKKWKYRVQPVGARDLTSSELSRFRDTARRETEI